MERGVEGGGGGGGGGSPRADDGSQACWSFEDAANGRCKGAAGEAKDKDFQVVEEETAVPFPPRNSGSITLSSSVPQANGVPGAKRATDIDVAMTSLHVPPGAVFEHGVPLGMTIMARTSDGQVSADSHILKTQDPLIC